MTAPPANLIQTTPFLGVSDLSAAIAFYRDVLGFRPFVEFGGYAYLERERVGLRLLALDDGALNPPGCGHVYIDVYDTMALHEELVSALSVLAPDRYGPPKDHPYGQREFWVRDPDGNLITFGQGIGANAGQWDYRNEP